MAAKKFLKGSEEWMMFMDFWKLCQDYWEPEDNQDYWKNSSESVMSFAKKMGWKPSNKNANNVKSANFCGIYS